MLLQDNANSSKMVFRRSNLDQSVKHNGIASICFITRKPQAWKDHGYFCRLALAEVSGKVLVGRSGSKVVCMAVAATVASALWK